MTIIFRPANQVSDIHSFLLFSRLPIKEINLKCFTVYNLMMELIPKIRDKWMGAYCQHNFKIFNKTNLQHLQYSVLA